MTTENTTIDHGVQAGADLTADMLYKGLTIGGTVAANNLQAAGILQSVVRSGQGASVAVFGVTKVKAGAAVNTLGFGLKITTSGFIVAAASGDSHIGRALETCASGDLMKAFINFTNLPAWPQNV